MAVYIAFSGDIHTRVLYAATTLLNGMTAHWQGDHGSAMPPNIADALVTYLQVAVGTGSTLVSFNGAGFGFQILSAVSSLDLTRLVMGHTDIMVAFVADNGYMASLDSFASVIRPGPKIPIVSWLDNPDGALSACDATAAAIKMVHEMGEARGLLVRKSKQGKSCTWYIRGDLEVPPIKMASLEDTLQKGTRPPAWVTRPVDPASLISWMHPPVQEPPLPSIAGFFDGSN